MRRCCVFFFVLYAVHGQAAGTDLAERSLQPGWMVYTKGVYEPATGLPAESPLLHFFVNAVGGDSLLEVKNPEPVTLFVEGTVLGPPRRHITVCLDSLVRAFGRSQLLVSVYAEKPTRKLTTCLVRTLPATTDPMRVRKRDSFRDFAVLGMLALLVIVVIARQTEPKLFGDYFSLRKVFLRREADDSQFFSRITGSSNFIFYGLCALIGSYFLVLILHGAPALIRSAGVFPTETFGQAMIFWLGLTLIILIIFAAKWLIIQFASSLFDFRETVRQHFFNWIRVMLLLMPPFTLLVLAYYLLWGTDRIFFGRFIAIFLWIFLGWVAVMFHKLSWRNRFSLFHIISYICVTELIPLIILSRILYA